MAPTAPRAILCGDPARALLIAQAVLVEPRMSNHHRGLWGYWGRTDARAELTVHATGIGGPSAAVVLAELADAGLEAAVRVGTCVATDATVELGATVVAGRLDPALTGALIAAGAGPETRLASDGAPADRGGPEPEAAARDMQTATLARVAAERGLRFAAALVVVQAGTQHLEDDALDDRCERLGRIAAGVLAAVPRRATSPSS